MTCVFDAFQVKNKKKETKKTRGPTNRCSNHDSHHTRPTTVVQTHARYYVVVAK
uniref:Uncharacterized protein n=1 Tax=Arundo donax TaxID=35708 RepID=A0A0A9PK92_ARUDO